MPGSFGRPAKGIYIAPLPPTKKLAQVAVADIGDIAVRVLEDAGRPFTYQQVPLAVVRRRMGEDVAEMYEWFDRVGHTVDRAMLLRVHQRRR